MEPNNTSRRETVSASIPESQIISILEVLSYEDLYQLAIDVIRENRRRVGAAQALYERLEAGRELEAQEKNKEGLYHDYRLALLEQNIFHHLVRTLIGFLNHIPELPEDKFVGQ